MNLSQKFRRFAAECEAMSKCAKTSESKASWDGMAARWILFAERADDRYSPKVNRTQPRRRRGRYYYPN
jgi:hypothetical protein